MHLLSGHFRLVTNYPRSYDFTLTWMHDPSGDDAIADSTANFRDALKIKLGLKLKPSHGSISFLIVDHVERPSEN